MRHIIFALAVAISCPDFCSARMYVSGEPTEDRKACYCKERVELDTPAAILDFHLVKTKTPTLEKGERDDYEK